MTSSSNTSQQRLDTCHINLQRHDKKNHSKNHRQFIGSYSESAKQALPPLSPLSPPLSKASPNNCRYIMMIPRFSLPFFFMVLIALGGCGNYLAAPTMASLVGKTVSEGVFGKLLFDPVWEYFFGNPHKQELENVKNEFIQLATNKMIAAVIPSAHAGEIEFQCNSKETEDDCVNRAASIAEYKFNIYATNFINAFEQCRDRIVLTEASGALDYTKQVKQITRCIANAGYQKEIALILAHIERSDV